MKNKKNLILLDINSHIHRAFFVAKKNKLDTLENSYFNGKPNYIIKSALKLIESEISKIGVKPDYIACILDHKDKNFRHEIYPEYKANRPKSDKDLVFMRECIFKLLHLKGYFVIRKKGYEADDVIGTIAKKASSAGVNTYICAKDKDLAYLLDKDNIFLFNGTENKLYNKESFEKQKGVKPKQIIDFLTIDGDKVDNILGIPNCGKATALKILAHHTLDEIIEDPDLLRNDYIGTIRGKEKTISYIKENKDFIKLMKEVVTIKDNLNLGITLQNLKKKYEDDLKIKDAYKKLGLKM